MKVKLESQRERLKKLKLVSADTYSLIALPLFVKIKWLGIMLGAMILGDALTSLTVDTGIGVGLNIAFAILYNNFYINDLLKVDASFRN